MKKVADLLGKPDIFLEKLFKNIQDDGIDISDYLIDHICYRVETTERYNELTQELIKYGVLLSEKKIAGRLISSFKLDIPIIWKGRAIGCLELPAPHPTKVYRQGWEHVECVINVSFQEFIKEYSSLRFNFKGIDKEINPDIGRNYIDGSCIKFHHNSLEYVITYLQ